MASYPTLALIDRARAATGRPFAGQPNAAHLERVARALADEYWGEAVWLTGVVPDAAFRAVCAALDAACPAREPVVHLIFAGDAPDLAPATDPIPVSGVG